MEEYFKNGKIKVRVKPNSKKTEVEGYDEKRGSLVVRLKAPADKGKANVELAKFVSRKLGKPVKIKSGLASKDKVLEVISC